MPVYEFVRASADYRGDIQGWYARSLFWIYLSHTQANDMRVEAHQRIVAEELTSKERADKTGKAQFQLAVNQATEEEFDRLIQAQTRLAVVKEVFAAEQEAVREAKMTTWTVRSAEVKAKLLAEVNVAKVVTAHNSPEWSKENPCRQRRREKKYQRRAAERRNGLRDLAADVEADQLMHCVQDAKEHAQKNNEMENIISWECHFEEFQLKRAQAAAHHTVPAEQCGLVAGGIRSSRVGGRDSRDKPAEAHTLSLRRMIGLAALIIALIMCVLSVRILVAADVCISWSPVM
jgi:hypothetical protein